MERIEEILDGVKTMGNCGGTFFERRNRKELYQFGVR